MWWILCTSALAGPADGSGSDAAPLAPESSAWPRSYQSAHVVSTVGATSVAVGLPLTFLGIGLELGCIADALGEGLGEAFSGEEQHDAYDDARDERRCRTATVLTDSGAVMTGAGALTWVGGTAAASRALARGGVQTSTGAGIVALAMTGTTVGLGVVSAITPSADADEVLANGMLATGAIALGATLVQGSQNTRDAHRATTLALWPTGSGLAVAMTF